MEHAARAALPLRPDAATAPGTTAADVPHSSPAIMLGGILAVAAVLRFALLGRNSVWFDEAYVIRVALAQWQAIPGLLRTAELHPPLYYILMKAWIGTAGLTDWAIRVPSACFSLLAVGLTYAVVRRVSTVPVSLLSALLAGASPFAVMAGQDAKMYALLSVLTLASTLVLAESVERGGAVRWGAYVLATTLMVYTHYLGFLVLVAQGAWVAGFGRTRIRAWLLAAGTAAMLYAPWAPSLWSQMTRAPASTWYDPATLQDLSQLLGLYAFGGSLLGMPSVFFSNTSLAPAWQIVLVLPFLILVWRGAKAFARDGGHRAAYLGLPLVVPIGVTFAIALVRPPFEARWFSFLVPFYVAMLARGIIDVAEHARRHHRQVAAGLAAGLLLYSVPVFDRYYFDPHFRPYQWREAAAIVRSRARPGDLFVYGDYQSELTFTYYFGPTPGAVLLRPEQDIATIRRLAGRHRRMWLIAAPPLNEAVFSGTLEALKDVYTTIGRSRGGGIFPVVYLLKATGESPQAP